MKLTTLLLALVLCASCGYHRQVVELSPRTYAMDAYSFHLLLVSRHFTPPEVWNGCAADMHVSQGALNPNGDAMIDQQGEVHGIYFSRTDTIAIIAADPHHLTYRNVLCLSHERAHRDDALHFKHEGASPLWRFLAVVPGGQEWLTHESINHQLRTEGYSTP